MSDFAPHLAANDIIETGHPRIRALVAPLQEAATDTADLARRVFELARDSVVYSPFVPFYERAYYRATATLERGRGYCVQKAVVLVTLARAVEIPARLVFVDIRNHRAPQHLIEILGSDLFTWHCYGRLHVDGRWLDATPAFDRAICEEHDLPLVEFDGRESAIFPAEDHAGRRYVEYVAEHGVYDDVPLGPMLTAWDAAYGAEKVAGWRETLAAGGRME
jgi:transglutaminase-like putative cysteine protease